MKPAFIVLLAVWCIAGCSYGMTVGKFRPASSPEGVHAVVTTSSLDMSGELIEVQESGLVILTSSTGRQPTSPERRLRLVPFSAIRSTAFDQLGSGYRVSGGSAPTPAAMDRLRRVSRFPHGLAPELLKRLLDSCGQTELAGVQP